MRDVALAPRLSSVLASIVLKHPFESVLELPH
jgi:hypothetical protein